ncbi:MAG: polyprenyl synthetase family protein, partial [Terrimicrobiaceae bacterium]|nr:polyprenyl synthetase family protein [Terrimicrobiaceae bacterium]
IHEGKTAAMIAASTAIGGLCAGAGGKEARALRAFGRGVGLAFQVMDDILDATQSTARLGKSAGKDARAGKATFPAVLGLDGARREAARLTSQALRALKPFGSRAGRLEELARWLLDRDY